MTSEHAYATIGHCAHCGDLLADVRQPGRYWCDTCNRVIPPAEVKLIP